MITKMCTPSRSIGVPPSVCHAIDGPNMYFLTQNVPVVASLVHYRYLSQAELQQGYHHVSHTSIHHSPLMRRRILDATTVKKLTLCPSVFMFASAYKDRETHLS